MNALLPGVFCWATVLLSAGAVAAAMAAEADETGAGQRLAAGDVVMQETDSSEAGGTARMQILVQAPAKAIWDVVVSCDLAFAFVEGLQECEVLEEGPDRALVHQVVKKGWPIPTHDFVFESLRQPYHRIDFHLVRGNLQAMTGSWLFSETADGTLVDHEVRVQPQMPVPRFLVRRNISRGMPDLLACVRGLAGGSLSVEGKRQDLNRCPGDPPPPAQ